jgi:hypothetical protein
MMIAYFKGRRGSFGKYVMDVQSKSRYTAELAMG